MVENAGHADRSGSSGAIGAIATFGMLAAPTAFGAVHAEDAMVATELSCVQVAHLDVERRLGGEPDIAASLVRGDKVTVLGRKDDKTHIRYRFDNSRRVGWVKTSALGTCSNADDTPSRPPPPTPPVSGSVNRPPTSGISFTTAPGRGEMRAHFINVGQGASTLYEFACGAALVDTGAEHDPDKPDGFDGRRELGEYLEDFFARRPDLNRTLDLLVVSHPHEDHAAGAALVTRRYKVKNVLTDGLRRAVGAYSGEAEQTALEEWAKTNSNLELIRVEDIPKGGKTDATIDPIACPGQDPKLRVLWGGLETRPDSWGAEKYNDANNHSIALRVDLGKASFLTTGDLTNLAVPDLIALHGDSGALDVDVWQVSHHGSHKATDEDILHAITPQIALLGTGDPTDPARHGDYSAFHHGHPRKVIIDLLFEALTRSRPAVTAPVALGQFDFQNIPINEAIYATGWDGTVVVSAKSDGTYEVATER